MLPAALPHPPSPTLSSSASVAPIWSCPAPCNALQPLPHQAQPQEVYGTCMPLRSPFILKMTLPQIRQDTTYVPPPLGCHNLAPWPPTVSTSQEPKVSYKGVHSVSHIWRSGACGPLLQNEYRSHPEKKPTEPRPRKSRRDVYFQPCTATCWPGWVVWSQRMGKRTDWQGQGQTGYKTLPFQPCFS